MDRAAASGSPGPLVFALLVLNRERAVSRDERIGVLWPAAPPADPDDALSALLCKLRRVIGKDRLTGRREVTLTLPADTEVDVEQAYSAIDRSEAAIAGGCSAAGASEWVPLPALLARRDQLALVRREAELERLRDAWASARGGQRGMVLMRGGPGIGKTRLAGELARGAHAGGTVLYAACAEDALISYQVFVEALRHYVRHRSISGDIGPGAAELARLIPGFVPRTAGDGEDVADDPAVAT